VVERSLISVVMPVHAGERWLAATLASIAVQPGSAVEVIIRDSSPGKSCEAIVQRYAGALRIDYRHMPEVTSWTRKTNLAVEAARAEHIAILHQDDLWLPDRLATAAEMIAKNPDAALHLSPTRIIDGMGRELGTWRPPFKPGPVRAEVAKAALLIQNSISVPAPLILRAAYLATGGLDEALWYTPDWDLWLKLAGHGEVVYDPRPTTAFRIHGNSLTMTGDRQEFADQLDAILARHLPRDSRDARVARASARINVLLAKAAGGSARTAFAALAVLLSLGPREIARYVHASRIIERVLPRLRARFSGAF